MGTDKWIDSLALLETIKITSKPSASAYSVIASKAFDNGRMDIGWQMLRECISAEKIPKCEVFQSYIRWCHNQSAAERNDNLTKMLQFIGQHDLIVSRAVINDLQTFFTEYNYSCHTVAIGKKYEVLIQRDVFK